MCKPLSKIFARGRGMQDIVHDILDPSDWWLRLYYGIEHGSHLWWYRSVRHPLQIALWLAQRSRAAIRT